MIRAYAPHPLTSAFSKIQRAKVHLDALEADIRNQTKPDIVVSRKNLERDGIWTGDVVDVLDISPHDPVPWSLILGDVVANLRASLDHIAWALAMLRCSETGVPLTDSQAQNVYFPIRSVPAHTPFRVGAGLFENDVRFFPARTWDVVDSFQPHNRAKRPRLELLAVLDELARIDKHRAIVIPERLLQLQVSPSDTRTIRQTLDKPHHQWLFSGPPPVDFEPDGKFDIVMYPATRLGRAFSALELSEIHDVIRDDVLPVFARFF